MLTILARRAWPWLDCACFQLGCFAFPCRAGALFVALGKHAGDRRWVEPWEEVRRRQR